MTEIINYRQLKETKQGLWRRFEKVKEALITSLKPDQTPEVNRELEETIWNGFDSGIRDYYGRIDGVVGGINLNVTISASKAEGQRVFGLDDDGNLVSEIIQRSSAEIKGYYDSADGMKGALEIVLKDGKRCYEAYWLSCIDGNLRLEQVVDPNGDVFNVSALKRIGQSWVEIPEIEVPVLLTMQKRYRGVD